MKKILLVLAMLASTVSFAAANKVLVVLSSEDKIILENGIVHPTGYFLPELGVPLEALVLAGYEPVFATPKGNTPTMDKVSDSAAWFGGDEQRYQAIKSFVASFDGMKNPLSLKQVLKIDLNDYAGILVPGGHAPMEDLYKDAHLGEILRQFHAQEKPTGLICHGPIALLSARENGKWIYSGYQMTVFSTAEEQQEEPGQDNMLGGYVLFYPDQALAEAGGVVSTGEKWKSHVVRDRELITGQNPMSDKEFAAEFVKALNEKN